MLNFFGQFESVEDLETRMTNTFAQEPHRTGKALARRIILTDMKLVKQPSGRITVFWDDGKDLESWD